MLKSRLFTKSLVAATVLATVLGAACFISAPPLATVYPVSFTSALPYPSDGRYSAAVVHEDETLIGSLFFNSDVSVPVAAAASDLGVYPFISPDVHQDSWWSAKLSQTAALTFLNHKNGPVFQFVYSPYPSLMPGDQIIAVTPPSKKCNTGCVVKIRRAGVDTLIPPVSDVASIRLPENVVNTTQLPRTPMATSGFSAGLPYALSYLDGFTPGDLSSGLSVGATGTVNLDGHVGEVSNVYLKVEAARRAGVDLFFVPSANLSQAQQAAQGSSMRIVPTTSLSDAVRVLCARPGVSDGACESLAANDQKTSEVAAILVNMLPHTDLLVKKAKP